MVRHRKHELNPTKRKTSNAPSALLSAIINLVCPQCGGAMLDFRCLGECSRDWRLEWALAAGISHAFRSAI